MSSGATCYYPNGNPSPGDIPCSDGDGVACCPSGWKCEPNGLCHLPSPFYYGRYTCTDKTWKSSGCPNVCTHDNTAAGDEAVLECSLGSYCCDANRPDAQPDGSIDISKGCCDTSTDRFPLAQLPLAPGGSGNTAGGSAQTTSSPAAASSDTSTSSSTSSSTTNSPAAQSTSSDESSSSSSSTSSSTTADQTSVEVVTSIVTSNGGSSTLVKSTTSVVPAAPASSTLSSPMPTPSSGGKSLGSIIGPAVGVPVAVLALAALAFFLFWRRRREKQKPTRASSPPPMRDNLQSMYPPDGKDLADSPYTGKSELEGSPGLAAASPKDGNEYNTPNDVGAGGGKYRGVSTLSQAPTAVGSPAMGNANDPKPELAASDSTRQSPRSNLGSSPAELPGSPTVGQAGDGQGEARTAELHEGNAYKPYRPSGLGLTE